MAFWDKWLPRSPEAVDRRVEPRAAVQSSSGGVMITNSQQLEEYLRDGEGASSSGASVTPATAMRVAAVYACVRIISGAVATLPLHIMRRVDDKVREEASDVGLSKVIRRKPNGWQKPAQFRRMMQAHVLLRGNAYALIVRGIGLRGGEITGLIPMHPDRVECKQLDDLSLEYTYQHPNGRRIVLKQSEVFHLVGLTLDGVHGVSPITYARETIGLSLSMEHAGGTMFRNGARASIVLSHPGKLGIEGKDFLKSSLDEYRSGGDSEGKALILEEGMKVDNLSLNAQDAQWIESRKFSRTDIFMFYGLPPHMAGDTEKSTSWGSGIEQQTQGFVAFTLEDHLTMWEEAITVDLTADGSNLYAKFNRNALVRGDLKTRTDHYVKMLQWGVYNPDKVLELEDENPREDGGGGIYYDPPNTAGGKDPQSQEPGNEPSQPA